MRCIHPTQSLALDGDMALHAPTLSKPLFSNTGGRDGRRLLALPGVIAVAGALVTAAISFAILV
ncbi:MAG: hypothetical protein E5W81_20770, partial [Mesorhizobium sp.]